MPTYKVRNVGQLGVISDIPPYDLPPNAWNDAQNVRFEGSKIEKFGGNIRLLERKVKDGEVTLAVAGLRDTRIDSSWIIATTKNLWKVKSPTDIKIASETLDGYNARPSQTWYYTTLSTCLVMNNVSDSPQGIRPNEEKFKTLPKWGMVTGNDGKPVQLEWRTNIIRSYKNFLIAMNNYEGEGADQKEYPQRVRWSDIADVNDLPQDWDDRSTTNSAGYNDLTDATGEILDGLPMRDSFIIYTTEDTFQMQYIGGNSIFRFTKLFSGSGILGRQCVAEFDGKHFVISNNDVYVHDGSSRKSIVAGRIREKLMSEITSVNPLATRVFTIYPKKEVWVCYARPGTDLRNEGNWTTNRAAVWNWEFDTWTFYDLPDNTDVNLVPPLATDVRKWEDYKDDSKHHWDNVDPLEQWEITSQNFASQVFVAMGKFGTVFQLDSGERFYNDDFTDAYNTSDGGAIIPITPDVYKSVEKPLLARMERRSLDFDEVGLETWGNVKVRKCYPQFTGEGSVRIEVGGVNDSHSAPNWKEQQMFNIGQQYQTCFRTNNKYIAMRFTDDNIGRWQFTGYDLDIVAGGVR